MFSLVYIIHEQIDITDIYEDTRNTIPRKHAGKLTELMKTCRELIRAHENMQGIEQSS